MPNPYSGQGFIGPSAIRHGTNHERRNVIMALCENQRLLGHNQRSGYGHLRNLMRAIEKNGPDHDYRWALLDY